MNERDLVRDQLICHQSVPIVLSGLVSGWAAASWTPKDLTEVLGDRSLQFRVGKLASTGIFLITFILIDKVSLIGWFTIVTSLKFCTLLYVAYHTEIQLGDNVTTKICKKLSAGRQVI